MDCQPVLLQSLTSLKGAPTSKDAQKHRSGHVAAAAGCGLASAT